MKVEHDISCLSFPHLIIWPFASLCSKAAEYFQSKLFSPHPHLSLFHVKWSRNAGKWSWKGPLEVVWSASTLDQLWSFVGLFKVLSGWSWDIPEGRAFWCLTSFVRKLFFVVSWWNFPSCTLCGPQVESVGPQTLAQSNPTASLPVKPVWHWGLLVVPWAKPDLCFVPWKSSLSQCWAVLVSWVGVKTEGPVPRKWFVTRMCSGVPDWDLYFLSSPGYMVQQATSIISCMMCLGGKKKKHSRNIY